MQTTRVEILDLGVTEDRANAIVPCDEIFVALCPVLPEYA